MPRAIASAVFLLTGLGIGLGAFGHGSAVRHLHAAIDGLPIDPGFASMLYVVWYFVSGCMLVFGATVVWSWLRLRMDRPVPLFACLLIGLLYLATGIAGLLYRHGDPFMWVFVVLGALLLASSHVLRSAL